ncbi:MAG: SGNH/GDSL hydrolase family protein [Abitibacteriaceae bacterium]|nr:SGNH/GDSL hydrolase family protein [Abditibacteriaceae bacterium]MBV9865014.1 SGNH/GDSL hydrolase family protein [Abditibacteriaceae bacterium]
MKSNTRRDLCKNILLSLMSIVVTLLVLEVGVRLFMPVPLVASDLFLVTERLPEVQARTARRALKPNIQCRQTSAEYDVEVRINDKGLRDAPHPYAKPPHTTRILVLGDSFVFGYGVEEPQRFTNLLEARLNSKKSGASSQHYEVISAGVPSWGTVDELLYLQEEGLKYHPDIVLLCFYENDVRDNDERDLFTIRNGQLIAKRTIQQSSKTSSSKPAPSASYITRDPFNDRVLNVTNTDAISTALRQPHTSFLIAHSHLARLVRLMWFKNKIADAPQEGLEESRAGAQELTAHLITQVQHVSEQAGATFKLVLIPFKNDATYHRASSLAKYPILLKWAQKQPPGLVLDLLDGIRTIPDPESLYFKIDRHLNARGHAAVAPRLEAFLRRTALRPKPSH